jgi:hypothetical protein
MSRNTYAQVSFECGAIWELDDGIAVVVSSRVEIAGAGAEDEWIGETALNTRQSNSRSLDPRRTEHEREQVGFIYVVDG